MRDVTHNCRYPTGRSVLATSSNGLQPNSDGLQPSSVLATS